MPTQEFAIAAPNPDDVEEMDAMWAQSWLDTYPREELGVTREQIQNKTAKMTTEESHAKRRKQIEESKGDTGTLWRIARGKTGKIIGLAIAHLQEGEQNVGALYVDKSHHGLGIAQALMEEMLAWMDRTKPIKLEVASYNERAIAFYRKYGFEVMTGSEHILHETIPVVTMIRKGEKQ